MKLQLSKKASSSGLTRKHVSMFEFPSSDTESIPDLATKTSLNLPLKPRDRVLEDVRKSKDFVRLDVGGRVFVTRKKHFAKFPQSRLWNLMRATGDRILDFCDGYHPGLLVPFLANYDRPVESFYFDHSGRNFDAILDLYRHGNLHVVGSDGCPSVTKDLLDYWGIDQYQFESCCALKYHKDRAESSKAMAEAKRLEKRAEEEDKNDDDTFGTNCISRMRCIIWNLTEYPESSMAGKFFVAVTIAIILTSMSVFLAELAFDFGNKDPEELSLAEKQLQYILELLDTITACFFLVEYVTRLLCTPNLLRFLFSILNFADLLSILPFLLSILMYELQAFHIIGKAGKLVHLIRVLRVFRVFKLIRHVQNLHTLLTTLKQAVRELSLILVIYCTAVTTSATIIYYTEKDIVGWNFTDSLWWAVMTFTTVGVASEGPHTIAGQILGLGCAMAGIFFITLHIPIVLNCFNGYYKNKLIRHIFWVQREKKLLERKKSRGTSFIMSNPFPNLLNHKNDLPSTSV